MRTRFSLLMVSIRFRTEHDMQDLDLTANNSHTLTSFSTPHLHLHKSFSFVDLCKSSSGVHSVLARAAGNLDATFSLHRLS